MLLYVPPTSALTENEVRADLMKAYEAVEKAESAGGDVHNLVLILNDATRRIPGASEAQLIDIKALVDLVLIEAPRIEIQGAEKITNQLYIVVVVMMIITAMTLVLWRSMSHWFWTAWLRMHRGWRVEKT
jgi:hypothetical protein